MSSHRDVVLAYPEPPASPLWHRSGPKARPITPVQQQRNCELLLRAQYTPRPHCPRTAKARTEAR
ncbi:MULTISPECIES: hypothetical protein [Streptomyces]|uniref:hypothetical protein n=1 Tax=Streptomyces TaxID=1883 RepID=UPI00017E8675|nr:MULTISPECIES: hypothetical protein [Streptomyces]AKL71212.1 hypothetical protein M444_38300 [Streptomyces sp. Mg1]AYV32948.1 hypothetical protein EES41_39945 [Streptomyces sp. ADI95-16]EDX25133.1 hypothetical protein SSAG_05000 [Streptomyces sp. Mg1]RPK27498.1 hypothetical protein EES37_36890 [Streptomyces sp. ADI91-18]WBY24811.1 hypothetical protein PET44_34590 [Streptomyces goshikiensis]